MNPPDVDTVQVGHTDTDREATVRIKRSLKIWRILPMIALFLSIDREATVLIKRSLKIWRILSMAALFLSIDREATVWIKRSLKIWKILSMAALFLSIGMTAIGVLQAVETDSLVFISTLFSGLMSGIASFISLCSVSSGDEDGDYFLCCTVCFFMMGVLSVASSACALVFVGIMALINNDGLVELNAIVLCLSVLLFSIIMAAMVIVCCHCNIFFYNKPVRSQEERLYMQQPGFQGNQAGTQPADGFQVQTGYQPAANRYICQQEGGSLLPVPQGQGQAPTSYSRGPNSAPYRDTVPSTSNTQGQGQRRRATPSAPPREDRDIRTRRNWERDRDTRHHKHRKPEARKADLPPSYDEVMK